MSYFAIPGLPEDSYSATSTNQQDGSPLQRESIPPFFKNLFIRRKRMDELMERLEDPKNTKPVNFSFITIEIYSNHELGSKEDKRVNFRLTLSDPNGHSSVTLHAAQVVSLAGIIARKHVEFGSDQRRETPHVPRKLKSPVPEIRVYYKDKTPIRISGERAIRLWRAWVKKARRDIDVKKK